MQIDRSWAAVGLLACGLGAVVFAMLPGPWPNPLLQGDLDVSEPTVVQPLRAAAAAVDAACRRGDLAAFAEAVTPQHRAALDQALGPFGRGLDAAALQELGADQADWLDAAALAGVVEGQRAAIALRRPAGDGAQVMTFEWDGQRLRLAGSLRDSNVHSAAAARAAVRAAVTRR